MNLREMLIRDEGLRLKPYHDTAIPPKLTIGVGHNLDDKGISERVAMVMLDEDIRDATNDLQRNFPWFDSLDEVRKVVLINMSFNLGIHRLMGFRKMLKAVSEGDFETAAKEMKDSKWFVQVKGRGERLKHAMKTGELI